MTASTGTAGVGGEAVLLAVGGDPLLDGGEQVGVQRAEVRARAGGAVVAVTGCRRPGVEVLGGGEVLAEQLAADDLTPSRSISEPLAWSWNATCETAVTTSG